MIFPKSAESMVKLYNNAVFWVMCPPQGPQQEEQQQEEQQQEQQSKS
jgi:hypothetical protein